MDNNDIFTVSLTGAAGNIGSILAFLLVKENYLLNKQKIKLKLVDLPQTHKKLQGIYKEIFDCNFPNLHDIEIHQDSEDAFRGSNLIILAGAKSRGPGMKRKDLLEKNIFLFREQAEFINNVCTKDTKVLVVGNPCNTLSYIVKKFAHKLETSNITCLSYLDYNRAMAQVNNALRQHQLQTKNVFVIGNHSSTMHVDYSRALLEDFKGNKIDKKLQDVLDEEFLDNLLQERVRKRGEEIIDTLNKSAGFSAAMSIINHLQSWFKGSNEEIVAFGIFVDQINNQNKEIFITLPVTCKNESYYMIENYIEQLDEKFKVPLMQSIDELCLEKKLAKVLLNQEEDQLFLEKYYLNFLHINLYYFIYIFFNKGLKKQCVYIKKIKFLIIF